MKKRVGKMFLVIFIAVIVGARTSQAHKHTKTIQWDQSTLVMIAKHAVYGRMVRLTNGDILCAFDRKGNVYTNRSLDEGKTWSAPKSVIDYKFGSVANPELLQLANGRMLLSYNERPRDGKHHFTIHLRISDDGGETWTTDSLVYQADTQWENGCWEPAQIQLPSGEIQLYFANENPYRNTNEQEISMVRSNDNGLTWSRPTTICFRANHRDGMPVPLILNNGKSIVVAIEDNAINRMFRPAIVSSSISDNWKQSSVKGDDPRRWWALAQPFPINVNAAAPYIRQFPTGETVLSCQLNAAGEEPVMVVYIGDENAGNFGCKTVPFRVDQGKSGQWNSLFIKNHTTVTALSGTTVNGGAGLWAIDGRLVGVGHVN